jgi:type I restriction enzyme, S subunit
MSSTPLIDVSPEQWEIVSSILQKHVPQYAVWAFGSRAKWTAKQFSDLDLAVITAKPLPIEVSAALGEDFKESDLPWKVDVVDWATTSGVFRGIIERDRVVVQPKLIVSAFPEMSLAEIADFRNGKAISPEKYTQVGKYPVYGSNGQIARTDEVLSQDPAIVIGRVGAYCGCVHFAPHASWVTDNAIIASPKAGNDLRYLFYLLGSLQLERTAIGSAQPLMTQGGLKVVKTKVPPLPEQKAIVAILGSLDDKIELNRRMNATLEAMARALFQSWFVDFDPVRAKMDGRAPVGMDAETAALFPDSFEDSNLPLGWSEKRVNEIMVLSYGKALKSTSRVNGNVPVYGSGGLTGCHDQPLVAGPSVIVGRKGTVGSLFYEDRPFYPIDTVFYVQPIEPLTFCFYLLQTLGLSNMNTDAAVPGLNRENVYRLAIAWAGNPIIKAFDDLVTPIRDAIFSNKKESVSLVSLRDSLLPQLLTGHLSVSTSNKFI